MRLDIQFFGGRGSASGKRTTERRLIESRNTEGQTLRIPRSTYEDRLADVKRMYQGAMDNLTNPKLRASAKPTPEYLNKLSKEMKDLEKILKTGKDHRYL